MKVRSFHTKIWNDEFFAELTPTEKLLFIYYIFNPRVNIIYCYECPDRTTKFETGLSQDLIANGKAKFSEAGKLYFYQSYVFIANGNRYQTFKGEKNDKAKDTLLGEFSESSKGWFESVSDRGIDTPIDTPIDTQWIPPEIKTQTKTKTKIKQKRTTLKLHQKVEYLTNIPEEDLIALKAKFDVSLKSLVRKGEELSDYCASHGKTYKDYKAFMRAAISRDFKRREVIVR